MGFLEWLGVRSDSKRFEDLDQPPVSDITSPVTEITSPEGEMASPEMVKPPHDEGLLLNSILSANATQQHYINEMLTRAIGELVIKPGDTVLDVGANQGFHLFAFADLAGDQGLVHAFEPNPLHWPLLVGKDNVRFWPFAAGDKCSVERFFFPKHHHGAASLHDPRDFLGEETEVQLLNVIQVTVDSLDEVFQRPVQFIKLDVERHEFQALAGMTSLIARDRPIIVLENATQDIQTFFAKLRYRLVPMTYAGWGSKDTLLPNVMFVPNERTEAECAPGRETVFDIIDASHGFR